MNIYSLMSRIFAGIALVALLYGFIIPSVGFNGTLERIKDNKVEDIPSYVYPLWNFYQKDRYISVNTQKEARANLKKMIEISEEIGVPSLPVWNFSLEAPNYPKKAFPYGLPVYIHFDGLSGEVHEMNTINHYVGMAPMERGGIYESTLAPYALILLGMIFMFFITYNNKFVNRLMIIPVLLPFIFLGIYAYWLYWFGHNLHEGAITIEPFTPVILGDGKVAQFTTHAYPVIGFWVLVAISILSLIAWWLKSKSLKKQPFKKTTILQHSIFIATLLIGIGTGAYVLKTDIEVDTLAKVSSLIDATKVTIPITIEEQEPTKEEKEVIEQKRENERKEQELKIKTLEKRAGSAGKFKVSSMYKSNCAPCHGASGEGSMGSKLIGLSKEELLRKSLEYKANEEEMHIAVFGYLSDEELEKLAEEIATFGDQ
ncbi:hypothetical protein M947_03245 [Sulfurimonas hongkongensis]|uniref:Cytochrome c domain-containing protein n=1 Tax=Sulfurimonas hongkongensis TaxID=1172190 RepID=T0JG17_9BACT|nr:hypothetical protein M947_03245 [Sulfurimonas hongkongensis]